MNTKARRTWNIIALALIVAGLLGFVYPLAANIYDWFHQTTVTEQAKSEWGDLSEAEELKEFELAKRYNEQLVASTTVSAVSGSGLTSVATGAGISDAGSTGSATSAGVSDAAPTGTASVAGISGPVKDAPVRYDDVFRNFPVFATISIPSVGIDTLPIRHGVSDEVLWQGAGHLPNTSFPIGGESTHAVITAHSGLINHSYFTDLPNIKKGDYFYFNTLGRNLAYRVISVKTIKPTDTGAIAIVPGKDLASLVTCVPIGINTHRLLVTGERADDAPEPTGMGWLRPLLSGLALLALLLLLLLLLPYSACRIVITNMDGGGAGSSGGFNKGIHWVRGSVSADRADGINRAHEGKFADGADSARAFDWGLSGLHAGERADEAESTYVEGSLRFAVRIGDNLLVKRKNNKGKSDDDGNNHDNGKSNGKPENMGKSKHKGRVVRIFVWDDEDSGTERDGTESGGLKGDGVMRGGGWREVTSAKAKTLVRFEVEDLDTCEMPHDTLVGVRRRWSLAAMMSLPLAFAFPLFFTAIHGDTSAYAALAESPHASAPNPDAIGTATPLILSLLLLAELIIIRTRLRPTTAKRKKS